jgi:DEAD/DEAH box helicase domain-containing protein
MPGSKGLNLKKNNEEFLIEGVFFSPVFKGLAYRGKHLSETGSKFATTTISVPINSVIPIPGESKLGVYEYETGELKAQE